MRSATLDIRSQQLFAFHVDFGDLVCGLSSKSVDLNAASAYELKMNAESLTRSGAQRLDLPSPPAKPAPYRPASQQNPATWEQ